MYLFSIFVVGPMLAVHLGASSRVMARYDAFEVVRTIERDGTTIAAAVPLFCHDLRGQRSGVHAWTSDAPARATS
ncbi:hypothetical protein ACIO1C_24690 [Streptomyces sp. NPDC087420]|uniref:hypothetical protein n=1 Tax=Streptomyces sp. NPDC087420 TaxID=3365785 RepID=UPI003839AA4F